LDAQALVEQALQVPRLGQLGERRRLEVAHQHRRVDLGGDPLAVAVLEVDEQRAPRPQPELAGVDGEDEVHVPAVGRARAAAAGAAVQDLAGIDEVDVEPVVFEPGAASAPGAGRVRALEPGRLLGVAAGGRGPREAEHREGGERSPGRTRYGRSASGHAPMTHRATTRCRPANDNGGTPGAWPSAPKATPPLISTPRRSPARTPPSTPGPLPWPGTRSAGGWRRSSIGRPTRTPPRRGRGAARATTGRAGSSPRSPASPKGSSARRSSSSSTRASSRAHASGSTGTARPRRSTTCSR